MIDTVQRPELASMVSEDDERKQIYEPTGLGLFSFYCTFYGSLDSIVYTEL